MLRSTYYVPSSDFVIATLEILDGDSRLNKEPKISQGLHSGTLLYYVNEDEFGAGDPERTHSA